MGESVILPDIKEGRRIVTYDNSISDHMYSDHDKIIVSPIYMSDSFKVRQTNQVPYYDTCGRVIKIAMNVKNKLLMLDEYINKHRNSYESPEWKRMLDASENHHHYRI